MFWNINTHTNTVVGYEHKTDRDYAADGYMEHPVDSKTARNAMIYQLVTLSDETYTNPVKYGVFRDLTINDIYHDYRNSVTTFFKCIMGHAPIDRYVH